MVMSEQQKKLNIFAWLLSAVVSAIAFASWGQTYKWELVGLSTYQIFPLLGILAFSIMWSHYIVSVVRQYLNIDKSTVTKYFNITSMVVLTAIMLHPGLLIWQLWRDGLGLPPGSYLNYVAPMLKWVTLLGTVSFFVFMAYELRHKFGDRKWWKYVSYSSDAAMLAVFYHGLRLGTQLQEGWFVAVWYFYGITLIGSLIYIHAKKLAVKNQETAL